MSRFCFSSDSAVSPVIAAILIIALTVIIAASVGAVVLGLVNPASLTGKVVGVTAEPYAAGEDHGVRMTYWGGRDAGQLESIRAEVGGYELVTKDGKRCVTNPVVGGKYDFSLNARFYNVTDKRGNGGTNVITTQYLNASSLIGEQVAFVGTFKDGTEQVIYLWKVSIPGVTPNSETYVDGDANITIMGFSNTTFKEGEGVPGHGIVVERINPAVTKVEITAVEFNGASDENSDKTYNNLNYVFSLNHRSGSFSESRVYLPTTQTYNLYESERGVTIDITPGNTLSNALKGQVTLAVTVKGESKPYSVTFNNVYIPPRLCAFTDDVHTATINPQYNINDDDGNVTLTLDSISTSNIKENKFIVTIGNDKKVNGTMGVSGNTRTLDLQIPSFDGYSGDVNVYVWYKVKTNENGGTTQVWYLVASKSISDLTQSP